MVALALGTMNFGGRTGEAEALALVERALEAGITWFDTANLYGDGAAERLLGRALRGRRGRARIATKVGLARHEGRVEGLSRRRLLGAVDESLRRLGTDHVDLYYLHAPDRSPAPAPIDETLGALDELRRAGKILAWGVSNHAAWQILELLQRCDALGLARPAASQVLYNLAVRQLEVEYFRFTARYPIHTTIYNPLAGGLLSGRYRRGEPLPAGSRFSGNPIYQRRYLSDRLLAFAEACAEVARGEGLAPVELAYAWLAGRPGVDSILVGPATVAQLEVARSGCARVLSPGAQERLATLGAELAATDAVYAR